jgi:hypothetical protein
MRTVFPRGFTEKKKQRIIRLFYLYTIPSWNTSEAVRRFRITACVRLQFDGSTAITDTGEGRPEGR